LVEFHDNWDDRQLGYHGYFIGWYLFINKCPACKNHTIELQGPDGDRRRVFPSGASRGPISPHVPRDIAIDYVEACNVLPISPKASAALSRRCLQQILHRNGYKGRDLAKEIDLLLNEPDPKKAISTTLRTTVDGIRNFGNFSAHPITELTSLQIIDVEDHEAEWCLEILEEAFQHFYVRPAEAAARKAALNAKLGLAGKPPAK
jgi:hypothetical protein